MRILYICHRIPYPPNKGEKIRAYHQLKALSERHQVDLHTLADERVDASALDALQRCCGRVMVARIAPRLARLKSLSGILSGKPLTLPYFYSPVLQEQIREAILLRHYDRIFVYSSAMNQYINWVRDIPVITDLVDVDSDKWIQYAAFSRFPANVVYKREGIRLREHERSVCRRSTCVIVSTEREARVAREIAPHSAVHVIANGVDAEYFKPVEAVREDGPAIIFTGDMGYFPNEEAVVLFVTRIFPLVQRQVPDVRFLIVGRNPTRRVRSLARIGGVHVTGSVPDVRPWLARAAVAVAPFSIATGVQNKILEALASGLPVVATQRALQGLAGAAAAIIRRGDHPNEFAGAVVEFLRNPGLAAEIGREGRRRVMSEYSWTVWGERLTALVENPSMAEAGRVYRGTRE